MKKTLLTAAIALTGLAAFTSANAQSNGDAFLGFEATSGTGSSTNFVVDLGAATNLASLNLNLAADLTAVYGSGWASDANLYYGIIGGAYTGLAINGDSGNTLYASIYSGGTSWKRGSVSSQGNIGANIGNLAGQFGVDVNNGQLGVAANSVYMNNQKTSGVYNEAGNWSSRINDDPFFGFSANIETSISGSLDLYKLVPGSARQGTVGLPGTLVTTIALGSNGTISAVPEPSTYVLFGLGALVLIVAARRRNNA